MLLCELQMMESCLDLTAAPSACVLGFTSRHCYCQCCSVQRACLVEEEGDHERCHSVGVGAHA